VAYCTDFKLDITESLCLYLTCLLLPSSDTTSGVPSVPFSVVRHRAEQACLHINPEPVVETLENIFAKTSPYDYERLEFVLDQLMSLAPSTPDQSRRSLEPSTIQRDKNLLVCLKSYRRVSPPGEDELLSGDEAVWSRLPFHPLRIKDQNWRIITAELNADTVHLWIPMAAMLRLSADSIYVTAVRNIVESHISELPTQAQWTENSIDTKFMDTIQRLLSQVSTAVKY